MANEFNIKNGFISNANSLITGNLTVTGGSQTLISGNSSSEMLRVIQVGSGDAFVVEDQANSDPSHFVINASGDTSIGLVQPLNGDKLTVSGNTTIYGVLSATTIAGSGSGLTNIPIAGVTDLQNSLDNKFDKSGGTITGDVIITGNTNISGTTIVNGDLITNSTLKSLYSSGNDGGELFLNRSESGTSITGGVLIDIYQDRLRFFEQGNTERGFYLDITTGGISASTNLITGGGGEVNTASNLGSGTGLFAQKSGVDLQFKSLTSSGNTVTITNDSTTVNLEVIAASNFTGGTVSGSTNFISGLTANTIYTDYIDFNTGYTGATLPAGRLQWDDGNGTLVLGLKGGISDMEIGLENMALCYNSEATTLTAGTVVYVSGSQGNRPSIKRAIATGDGYSVTTLGMVSEPIASLTEGFITTFGMVNKLNTVGLSGGTPIWLSPYVAGEYTSIKPQAPNHTVLLGYVVRTGATIGSIFIHISNGWELDEIHDVRINDKTQGDLLSLSAYNGYDVWVNTKTLNGSYTITGDTTIGGNLTASAVNLSTLPISSTTETDVLVRNLSTGYIERRSINSLINVGNLVTVGLPTSVGVDYNSIKAAVDSITDASATNTYVVNVGPGVFNEDPITMKSYVDVIGASETNTIIQANNPNQSLIIGADQSMINNVQIQGCTGTSVAAVVYSSATTPQLNAIFYVENVRFGANYTHAKTVGTGGGNCIMQCSNVKYGGYEFTVGFYVTNDGYGIGRMQLRNVTSTNGGVTSTTGLIFAKADQPNCAFIVNGCLLTKSAVGGAAGTGFWVENGGSLRLTSVNFQRWATGIYAPQTGSAPNIEAIALNFELCDTDVNIIHSGATGKIQGTDNYAKTLININAPLYEVNQDPRIITVDKKGGDFSSVKSAVDSITGSSITNRFLVSVGPGKFTEGLIDLTNKPFVSIEGSNILTTEIVPSGSTQHIIKIGKDNEVSFLSLSGAGANYAGLYIYDIGDYGQAHKVSFTDCDINVLVESTLQETIFYGEYLDFNGTYTYGVKVISNGGFKTLANVENYYNFPSGSNITYCNYASGSGATLNVFVGDNVSNGVSGSTAFLIRDNAQLNTSTITVDDFTYGIRNPNVGGPIRFDVDNASFVNCEWDLYVENQNTFGTFGGSSNHEKIYSASENVYWGFLDINDGEFDITRKISVTFPDGSHTDLSTLVFGGGTMGLISGGTLTNTSGTSINVASGFGYLEKSDNSGIVRRIDFSASSITLSGDVNEYLYFNENNILSNSGSLPLTVNNIVLGRVVTDATSVRFIDLTPVHADHTANRFSSLLRNGLGPIYSSGSIVTENTTPFHINVSAGEYYYSSNKILPSGGTDVQFIQYYRDGGSGWNTSATTVVNNSYYDGNGSLSALTASAYTKHTLYTVGDGNYEKYFLVLGQNEYTTLVEAENALLPTPPTFFNDSVAQIANIYIRQGFSGITEFEDIRPVIGFKAGGVNASSLHANLLGLSSDDHTQYLRVDGFRPMANSLDMGNNTIYNVGTVDGVDVSAHASRHLPNGTDALTTASPIDVSTSNSIGIANSFARSDHQHALGSNIVTDSNISAHTSTKITITNKSLLNSNIVYSDQINNGVTATTFSSTTIVTDTVSGNIISGGTLYGDGSNITNIPIPYGTINAIANFTFLT